jgi:hypothetical protein
MKARGVVVAMLPGQSWVTSLVDRFLGERGNHLRLPFPAGQPGWRWAGPLPTVGREMGRRSCSSPSGRKVRTWRRGPASQRGGY